MRLIGSTSGILLSNGEHLNIQPIDNITIGSYFTTENNQIIIKNIIKQENQ